MTRYEAETTHGYGAGGTKRLDWSQFLVPIVAAVLVLALGLVWIGLTSEPSNPTISTPTSEVGVF